MFRPTPDRNGRVFWLPALASLLWLSLTFGLYAKADNVDKAHRLELEHIRLTTVAKQLLDARNWNAAHGGVYVPESQYGQPNPWLPKKERTLRTADGKTLVLMNPAYMSRQLAERNTQPGTHIAVVSRSPLRPENRADQWETEALSSCESGVSEVFSEVSTQEGKVGPYLRLMSVLVAQKSCLNCHVQKAEGDVLGGISVSLQADAFLNNAKAQERNMQLLYALLGLTGVLGIGGLTLNLTRRRWQAEETSRMKSAFMARLSHDMRTPLTAILGMSELLQKEKSKDKEKKQALRYLAQAGNALLEMVSDITDHAALEQGALKLKDAPFCLRQNLENCLALYRPAAEAKGIGLTLTVAPQVPDMLTGDEFRLRQALGNLISNAVKFTNQGQVCVEVEAESTLAGRLALKLSVLDTGPGLYPEDRGKIFESFQRGSQSGDKPGTGLGLNIARTIARSMGGDVRLWSEPGQGSRFCLVVCLHTVRPGTGAENSATAADTAPRTGEAAGPEAEAQPGTLAQNEKRNEALAGTDPLDEKNILTGKNILAAEDNSASRFYLERALQNEGAHPRMTCDGEETLDALAQQGAHWDLVILDASMPKVNGLRVLQRIRQGRTGVPAGQKVVIYTAALTEEQERMCWSLRPDGILLKPLSFSQLRQRLEAVLKPEGAAPEQVKAESQDAQGLAEAAEKALIDGVWDQAAALAAMDHDEELFEQLIEVLRTELAGMPALLQKAFAQGEWQTLRRLAHACKNSAATMRLDALRLAASRVEKSQGNEVPKAELTALLLALDAAQGALAQGEDVKESNEASENKATDGPNKALGRPESRTSKAKGEA